jgi:hypothetical protein
MPKHGSPAPPEAHAAAAPTRWGPGVAWPAGALLFVFDIAQGVLLLPWLVAWLGAPSVAYWVALVSALALVNVAAAATGQPLVRHIARVSAGGRAPGNWAALLGQTQRINLPLLLVLLTAFTVALLAPQIDSRDEAIATAVYFAGLLLRLAALNRFVLLNGVQQVGRDKLWLAAAAGLSLLATAGAAWLWRSISALAMAHAATAALLWLVARHLSAQVAQAAQTAQGVPAPAAKPIRMAEVRTVFMLHLAGFANLGTCVPLATLWLPADEGVAVAFWFRTLGIALALAGYAAQLSYPVWARDGHRAPQRGPVWRLLAAVAMLISALWLGLWLASSAGLAGAPALPWGMSLALAAVALGGVVTPMWGQWLAARADYRFAQLAIMLSWAAPGTALGLAWAFGGHALLLGYALFNLLLAAVMSRFAATARATA